MAQHVQETTVFERRLRPIYDSLEVGNNKKALQEVEKLLKKSPKLACARALKALALLRLGREEESNVLLNALVEEQPNDDATLQVLTFCYKEMDQLEKICELYNRAAKQLPGNEEILAHLFMSYVRLNDYKSQQATALQLYKVKPKNPYYFWAVMSVVLQGLRGPESSDPNKRKLYLALAQKMVDKLIAEDKLDAEQEVQLYLNILEEQGKYKEALEFMEGELCQKLYPGAPVTMKIVLLKHMSQWDRLNDLLKQLLTEERDRWDYYLEYINTCLELHKCQPSENGSNLIMEKCHEFLCELIEAGKRIRGPYLARLKLHCVMKQNNLNPDDLLGNFKDLILEYYHLFGDKPCCTKDITLFLNHLEPNERLDLAKRLLQESGISSTTLPQSREQMQKHICSLQLSRTCGTQIKSENENLIALYTALRLHYEHGYEAFGKDLLPTDMGPSDPYALLAAHIVYDVSLRTENSNYLIEALCLLYYVLKNSPSNFHVKLLCLKIFHFLGCGLGAQQIYELLDIKHVQLDSMGYLHCYLLSTTGLISTAKTLYDPTLKFFTTSYKERLEYIAMSYKFGSFSKLQEFMDFRDRLSNSLHYSTIIIEQLLLELICLSGTVSQNFNLFKSMNIIPQNDRINWSELSDNRDLTVVVNWDPLDLFDIEKNQKDSFEQNTQSLHIRSLMLRMIASFTDLLIFPAKNLQHNHQQQQQQQNSIDNTENINNCSDTRLIELLKNEWIEIFKKIKKENYSKWPTNQFLVNLLPSRLHLLLELPYEQFFTDLSQFIIDLYNGTCCKSSSTLKSLNENIIKIGEICCELIDNSNKAEDNIWLRRDVQGKIYSCIEILSLLAFVLSACYEKFSTSKEIQVKKVKKKEYKTTQNNSTLENHCNSSSSSSSTLNEKERLQIIIDLMRELKFQFQNCNNAVAIWRGPKFHSDLSECLSSMSLNDKDVEINLITTVINIFKDNHVQVVAELRNLIKDKIRMINK